MKFKIHFTLPDNTEDQIVLEAKSLKEIRTMAEIEMLKRGGSDPWSEELV